MKTNFIKIACVILLAGIALILGCKKDNSAQPTTSTTQNNNSNTNTDNYSSMSSFFAQNGVPAQTYTVNAASGVSFTTLQGTKVHIPANVFYNKAFQLVTGAVTITFKDIYKKSDMLLSNIPTNVYSGAPLKSGGEFFIKASQGGQALLLGNAITVNQPCMSPVDSNMHTFIGGGNNGWVAGNDSNSNLSTVKDSSNSNYYEDYVFSLYQFSNPVDSGSWCNSDNAQYFSAYPQTALTVQESDDPAIYGTYVFLVFKNINAMVHVYNGQNYTFPYNYAPVGLQCTVVAVGIKGGKVYSSFTPITISANQTITFSMSETTTANFKSQLAALN